MIKITDLYKSYGKLEVLKGVSAEIEAGECVAIIGGSGTGKSVFLRSLAMLEKPESGKGGPLDGNRPLFWKDYDGCMLLFQEPALTCEG